MERLYRRNTLYVLALVVLIALALPARTYALDISVSGLPSVAGSTLDFNLLDLRFEIYYNGYNFLATAYEDYMFQPACVNGGGKGGGGVCNTPPPAQTYVYSTTSVTAISPYPSSIDASFQFSGADAAGDTLTFSDPGGDSVTLTDAAGNAIPLGAPVTLTNQMYTLDFTTSNLSSILSAAGQPEEVQFLNEPASTAAPEPPTIELVMMAICVFCFSVYRRKRGESVVRG